MSEKYLQPQKQKDSPRLKRMSDLYQTKPAQSKVVQKPQKKKSGMTQQQQQQQQSQQRQSQSQPSKLPACCQSQRVRNFFCSWLLFVLAFVVYLMIWVIGHFSIQRLAAYYYFNDYNVSPYASLQLWKMSQRATNSSSETYFSSRDFYSSEELKRADAIALELFFSWAMWKLPLAVFTLIVIKRRNGSVQNYSTWGFFLALLLLIDIMAKVFRPEGYQDWVFFVVYVGLSGALVVANGMRRRKRLWRNLKDFVLPMLYIVLAYVAFSLLVPGIYGAIYRSLAADAVYIVLYIIPAIDLIFYSLIILISYLCSSPIIKFTKTFHFLNTGYLVGNMILYSPQDVEFYFLIGYMVVRNLSFNWVQQRVQKYVIVPCGQPGWLMVYLVTLCVNFVPWVGVGKLVVSKSFYSQVLQVTLPIQSYTLQKDYYAYYQSLLPEFSTFNPSLKSNIQISTIFIIWVLMTITQKYHISKVQFTEWVFYVFGIYVFYFGLVTGSQLYYLQANSV